MNICVIGTGYVGLVTGVVLANLGNQVICVDKDATKIDMLNSGQVPIFEPGLDEMIETNFSEGRINFSTDIAIGVQSSEIIFIAVGTPPLDSGQADLSAVMDTAHNIARSMQSHKIIVNKSTVPVGTGDHVRSIIEQHLVKEVDFDVVSNPEFLREGSAISDTLHPDRIVIGTANSQAAFRVTELYAPLERPVLMTDIRSAEMIKYASNAFLATKVSFVNAIANICERVGADVEQVARGMGYDARIGTQFLQAGLGYGGSCFGKDISSLICIAQSNGYDFALLKSVVDINRRQPANFIDRLRNVVGGLEGKQIGVLGLAFKPNTDDMRDAKSIDIIKNLISGRAHVRAYDPVASENAREVLSNIEYCKSAYDVANNADALIVATDWDEFKRLDMQVIKTRMNRPLIFDGRNIYDASHMHRLGFEYHCIGKLTQFPHDIENDYRHNENSCFSPNLQ